MAIPRKKSSKKLYLTLVLLVILIVAVAAIVYASQPAPVTAKVGLQVGDTFTYSIKGFSNLTVGATETPGFSQNNETDYYMVTITNVNGTSITMNTAWRLLNGTETDSKQTIDLSTGAKTDPTGFWAIYSSNLNVGDLLRPKGFDGVTVNGTNTQEYASSTRTRNFFTMSGEFYDVRDPTHNTLMYDNRAVYFDKQTGMLTYFIDYQDFNNPLMTEVITWTLVNSSVWAVQ